MIVDAKNAAWNQIGFVAGKAVQGAKGVYGYAAEVGLKAIVGGAAEIVAFGGKAFIQVKLAILGGKLLDHAEGESKKVITNAADELNEGVKDLRLGLGNGLEKVTIVSLATLFPISVTYFMWPYHLEDKSVLPSCLIASSYAISLSIIHGTFKKDPKTASSSPIANELINRCCDRIWTIISPIVMPCIILGGATAMYQVNGCSTENQNHMCDTASTVGTVGVGFIVVGAGIFLYNTQKFTKNVLPISQSSAIPTINLINPAKPSAT